ncbi:GNAT family N-acetyltransferase [Streptomyces bauhiniae]|uniref:GNAT family N-acetyltransferase n=1 Tax=Streptomyces bauhiniae TaxID=2340725 RepID=UPI0037D5E2C8
MGQTPRWVTRSADRAAARDWAYTRDSMSEHQRIGLLSHRDSSVEAFEEYLNRFEAPAHEGFVICLRDTGTIVGGNTNNIVLGTLQCGTLGYTTYASTTRRGYVTEGVGLVLDFAFDALGLHRLEANIQPKNTPSVHVVKRLDFRREGLSTDFQFINGAWRDHERWAITATER